MAVEPAVRQAHARGVQERPEVTVRDPSRAAGPVGTAPPRHGQHAGGLVAAGTALLLALSVPLGRADPAAVPLSLTERSDVATSLGDQAPRSVLVRLDVELRNDGSRPVRVGAVSVGDLRSDAPVELSPGGTGAVRLVRTVGCRPDGTEPGLDPPVGGLHVRVLAGGLARDVLLPAGGLPLTRLRTATRRACGFPPVAEAVELMAFAAGARSGGSVVTLLLTNASLRRVRLVEVRPAPGLRLLTAPRLPHELPRTRLGGTPSPERLQLTVAPDCATAPRSADGSLAALPVSPVHVLVAEVAADGSTGPRVGPLRPTAGYLTLLREAYSDACA